MGVLFSREQGLRVCTQAHLMLLYCDGQSILAKSRGVNVARFTTVSHCEMPPLTCLFPRFLNTGRMLIRGWFV